jgi:hypothetical protein
METEGIKRIFGRSKETRKLQYTEYFGDGDSKCGKEGMYRSCPEASWDGTMETFISRPFQGGFLIDKMKV